MRCHWDWALEVAWKGISMTKQEVDVGKFVKDACTALKAGKRMTPQMQREWQRVRQFTIAQYGMDVWSAILKVAMKNDTEATKI